MTQSKRNAIKLMVLDLRFSRLIYDFEANGFGIDYVAPEIAEPIFELAGIEEEKQTKALKERYYVQIQSNAEACEPRSPEDLEVRAEEIWKWMRANR